MRRMRSARVFGFILSVIMLSGLFSCGDNGEEGVGFWYFGTDANVFSSAGIENISDYNVSTRGGRALFYSIGQGTKRCRIADMESGGVGDEFAARYEIEDDGEKHNTSTSFLTIGGGNSIIAVTTCPKGFVFNRGADGKIENIVTDATRMYALRWLMLKEGELRSGDGELTVMVTDFWETWAVDGGDERFDGCFVSDPDAAVSDGGYVYLLFGVSGGYRCFSVSPEREIREVDISAFSTDDGNVRLGYGDGKVFIYSNSGGRHRIFSFDDAEGIIADEKNVSGGDAFTELIFAPGYDAYFRKSGAVYGVNDGEEAVKLFEWFEVGIASAFVDMMAVIDGDTIYSVYHERTDGNYKGAFLRRMTLSEYLGENGEADTEFLSRETLTVAASESLSLTDSESAYGVGVGDYFVEAARKFGRENMKYKVRFDYISGDSDTAAGNLMRKMLSGDIPDLILFSDGLESRNFTGKEMFADIYGFLDSGGKYTREDFLGCVLKSFEDDKGRLPLLTSDFTLTSMSGKVGRESWTLEEFLDFAGDLPEGTYLSACRGGDEDPRRWLIGKLMPSVLGRFVNFDEKECGFDVPEFRRFLSVIKDARISTDGVYDIKRFADGEIALSFDNAGGIVNYLVSRAVLFGSGSDAVGLPGGAAISPRIQIGIPKDGEKKDAAWSLVSEYLDVQTGIWDTMAGEKSPDVTLAKQNGFPCTWDAVSEMFGYTRENIYIVARFCEYTVKRTGERKTIFGYRIGEKYYTEHHDDGSSEIIEVNYNDPVKLSKQGADFAARYTNNPEYTDSAGDAVCVGLDAAAEKTLRKYFSGACMVDAGDDKITAIILEEAEEYFNGVRELDDVVRIIDDRVQTRINE